MRDENALHVQSRRRGGDPLRLVSGVDYPSLPRGRVRDEVNLVRVGSHVELGDLDLAIVVQHHDGEIQIAKLHVGSYPNEIYLVADPATREAWVIDAGYEPERVAAAAAGLNVKGILVTHGRYDH